MLFLIEYDRTNARRVYYEEFADDRRREAQERRIQREVDVNRASLDHEVVLLEANSVDELRETHGRYFFDLGEMMDRLSSSTSTYVISDSPSPVVRETKD
jgi:hypothetical protein